MTQSKIDERTEGELYARAYLAGITATEAAAAWTAAAQRDGQYPEVTIGLSADETGRYSVDPTAPHIVTKTQRLLDMEAR